jgi:hypothetical protein
MADRMREGEVAVVTGAVVNNAGNQRRPWMGRVRCSRRCCGRGRRRGGGGCGGGCGGGGKCRPVHERAQRAQRGQGTNRLHELRGSAAIVGVATYGCGEAKPVTAR